MLQTSGALSRLVGELRKLPGIGERTALRLAFHLLRSPNGMEQLAEALMQVREKVRQCSVCHALTEEDPCRLCSGNRDSSLICVIETFQDLLSLERSNAFGGLYHVLNGSLSPLNGVTPSDLTIESLLKRIEHGGIEEVVIATNFTVEGEATALYLGRLLKKYPVRVTRLAHGIPIGSDIEFVDPATVQWAMKGRSEL